MTFSFYILWAPKMALAQVRHVRYRAYIVLPVVTEPIFGKNGGKVEGHGRIH